MVVFLVLIVFLSITFHEYAHGWVANRLGDPTAANLGRLTLNPLAHIDPFGTVIMPILLLILSKGTFAFGYAKPVPINPAYFKNPKQGRGLVSAAGPLTNLSIALVLTVILKIGGPALAEALAWGIVINLVLAILNLMPIPPLDGSGIIASLLPNNLAAKYLKVAPYGMFIVIALIMSGFFRWFILPTVSFILNNLLGIKVLI